MKYQTGMLYVNWTSPYTCGLTQETRRFPARPFTRFWAEMRDISFRASVLALAMCGATMQLSSVRSGSSSGMGSGSVTSRPAAAIRPSLSAR